MNTYEQLQLLSAPNSNVESSDADNFGCCSRYRACSDAKACLIPDLSYSKNCIYRTHLEAGNIFYGKNANNYRPAIYEEFLEKYSLLSKKEQDALRTVLHYFFDKKVGTISVMTFEIPEYLSLEKTGFFHLTMHPDRFMKKCTLSAMVEACGKNIEDANNWAKNKCNSDTEWNTRRNTQVDVGRGIKIKKDELEKWIREYAPEIIQRLPKNPTKWTATNMVACCNERILEANQWAKTNCPSQAEWDNRRNTKKDIGEGIKINKNELVHWILILRPDIFKELSHGICFIDIDLEERLELSEFFLDRLYQADYISVLDVCENDPRFLS